MQNIAVRVQRVSKWFDGSTSPRERFFRFFRPNARDASRFVALHDIQMEVEAGSAMGLLGRNGAGKSTLMQIIAGTMQPSAGRVEAHGRISPLLELGTGFNPEFTGSENVSLNAAVLGFSPREIRRKAQAIADFADIGEFIDRPVRTYSSGMFARLAFAVAIHMEPKILLVDEILSVGDMGFQQKCMNKLREMREEGLTLLFVSHSPDSIKSVCDTAVFLDHGHIIYAGPADVAVDRYLAFIRESSNDDQLKSEAEHPWRRPQQRRVALEAQQRYGSGHVQIAHVDVLNSEGERQRNFVFGEKVTVVAEIESTIDVDHLCVNLLVRDATGIDLFGTGTFDENVQLRPMTAGEHQKVTFTFPVVTRPGTYGVALSVTRCAREDYSDVFLFDQLDGVASYAVSAQMKRPVHYKVFVDTEISVT